MEETVAGGIDCTIGLNTPGKITGGLPLVLNLGTRGPKLRKPKVPTAEQEALERETQQRAAREREAQRAAQEQEAHQRARQEREAQQLAEREQEAQRRAAREREAQQRARHEREAQQLAEQERDAQRKAAREREVQQRARQEREAQQLAEQEQEAQRRAAREREVRQRAAEEQEAQRQEAEEQEAQRREAEKQRHEVEPDEDDDDVSTEPTTGDVQSSEIDMTECGLETLKLSSVVSPDSLAIRAHGKDQAHTPIYNIIQSSNGTLLGKLFVNEQTQEVELKNNAGLNTLMVNGGLLHITHVMNINYPDEKLFGTIDSNKIDLAVDWAGLQLVIERTYCENDKTIWPVHDADSGKELAKIYETEDLMKIELSKPLSNEISSALALFALKLLYTEYRLHRRPMPFGIICNLTPEERNKFRKPSLAILQPIEGVIMRKAAQNEGGWFADFLDINSSATQLLVAIFDDGYGFAGLNGVEHFVGYREGKEIHVYTPGKGDNELIGKFVDNVFYDEEDVAVMTLKTVTPPQGKGKTAVFAPLNSYEMYTPDSSRRMAVLVPDKSTAILRMEAGVDLTCKALLISYSTIIAAAAYRMFRNVAPQIKGCYP